MTLRAIVLGSLFTTACNPADSATCSGGGVVSAEIGVEEIVGEFVAYEDGDPVPVDTADPVLEFDYEIRGLDASDVVTVVLRLARDGVTETEDYLANADLRCAEPGPARYGAAAPWPGDWPDPSTLDGTSITVDTVFTDVHEISADVGIELVVDATP